MDKQVIGKEPELLLRMNQCNPLFTTLPRVLALKLGNSWLLMGSAYADINIIPHLEDIGEF